MTWRTGRYVELKAKQTCFIHRFPGTQPGVSHCCTQLDIFRLQPAASSSLITHSSLFRSSPGAWTPQPPFSAALYNTAYGLHHISASATAQSPSRPPKWQDPFTAYRDKRGTQPRCLHKRIHKQHLQDGWHLSDWWAGQGQQLVVGGGEARLTSLSL